MRALIIASATVGLVACGQIQSAKPEETRFVLQCDGESTEGSGNELRRYAHRNTVRFDLAAGTMEFWDAKGKRWMPTLPGVRASLEVSPTELVYRRSFGDEASSGSEDIYRFDRTIGSLSHQGRSYVAASDLGPAIDYPGTFEGRCERIDQPSAETAF